MTVPILYYRDKNWEGKYQDAMEARRVKKACAMNGIADDEPGGEEKPKGLD